MTPALPLHSAHRAHLAAPVAQTARCFTWKTGTPSMPVPCADPKDEEEAEETCTWFLKALDVKFAEQEAVIRQLLENGPFRFTSEAYRASMMSMPAEALDAGGVRGSIMSMQSMGMRGSIAMRGSVVNDAAATMRGSHLDEQDGPFQVEVIEEEPEILHVFSQDDFTGVGSVCSDPPRPKSPRKSRMLGTQVLSERWEPDPPMKSFVKGPLDGYMGLVVIINLSFMIVMTQWMGSQANESLDLPSENLPFSEATFEIAEYIFFGFYLLDVLVRIYVLRREWVFDPRLGIMYLNLFDAFLVGLNVFELFLFPLFLVGTSQDQQSNSLRVVKLMRIVRTLRIVKTLTMFRQLRLLVGTCVASIGALFWSMVLLLVLKLGFALIICQALQGFIMDPAADRDARLEMNNLYGSFLKALYTMFEVTHSGSWPAVVRPVIEKVSPWYAAFFLTYLTLVVFAVIRVVTALFIKETLASAANDADMVMEDARRAAAETNLKLEELFLEAVNIID
ncbi:unnamed protein product [Durusdinium trenchii]|uniref:Ion transport domain-containing protein n=1 Tax=Durusdinium trenchii TaxID=1381693 RepID=A0ABP0KKW3_9DINO